MSPGRLPRRSPLHRARHRLGAALLLTLAWANVTLSLAAPGPALAPQSTPDPASAPAAAPVQEARGYTAQEARRLSGELKNEGVRAYHRGLLSLAIDKLQATVAINLNDFFAHYYLGLALRDVRRYPEARRVLEVAHQLDPRYLPAQVALGHVALGQGDPDEARSWFQNALNDQATYAPALDGMGRLEEATGNEEAAIRRYRQAIEANRGFPDPYINLGNLFRRQGRTDDAITLFQEAIHFQPGFAEGYMFLGDAYGRLGRRTEATALLSRASELEPENPDPYIALGDLHALWDERVQAREAYDQARRLAPRRHEPLAGLAELARRDGDYARAEELMSEALRAPGLDDEQRTALLAGQTTYRIEGRRAEVARQRLDAARAALDATAEAMAGTGLGAATDGPAGREWGHALVHNARLRRDSGDQAGALRHCVEALDPLQRPVDLLSECAYDALQAEDWAAAATLLEEAAARDTTDARHLVNLGLAYSGLGRLNSALDAFDRALALDRRSARAVTYRGNTQYRLGRMEAAEASYRRALELTPDAAVLERLQRVLVHLEDLRLQREAEAEQQRLDAGAAGDTTEQGGGRP